jgi:hypothetical protein
MFLHKIRERSADEEKAGTTEATEGHGEEE